jgi:hypothetical protein
VQIDTLFPLLSRIDGDWYAAITAKLDDEPFVVMAGPFNDCEEARAHNAKWLELAAGQSDLNLVDMTTVSPKVRQTITDTRGWRQGQFERLRSWQGGDDLPTDLRPMN